MGEGEGADEAVDGSGEDERGRDSGDDHREQPGEETEEEGEEGEGEAEGGTDEKAEDEERELCPASGRLPCVQLTEKLHEEEILQQRASELTPLPLPEEMKSSLYSQILASYNKEKTPDEEKPTRRRQ